MAFITLKYRKAVSALDQQGATSSTRAGKRKARSTAAESEAKRPRQELDAESSLLHESSDDLPIPHDVLDDVEGGEDQRTVLEDEYEFTDCEQEDEVVDEEKPADIDYDRLHRNFMKKWSLKGQGIHMDPVEVNQNLARFRGRIAHVLKTWIDAAKSISIEEISSLPEMDLPMRRSVWALFIKLDVDATVKQILKDTPEIVQVVLGRPGPMTLDIINELPCDWFGNFLLAVYVDLTKHVEEEFFDPYVGSATGKLGAHGRCSTYQRIDETGVIPASTTVRHERYIVQPEVEVNIRILWLNNPNDKTSGYTSVAEQMWSSFFGCQRSPRKSPFATDRALAIGEAALPHDFRSMPHKGLNDAFQVLQFPIWRREHRSKCSNFNCQIEETGNWYSVSPLNPLGPRLCAACHAWRRQNNGETRPVKAVQLYKAKAAHPIPADRKCENCSAPEGPLGPGRNSFFYFLPKWTKWVCITCRAYSSNHDGALRPEAMYSKVIPKRAKGKKPEFCPDCQIKPERWGFDKVAWLWKCNVCYMAAYRANKST